MLNVNANKSVKKHVVLASYPLTTKIFRRFSHSCRAMKTPLLRAFKCANNRDFRFYAAINRGLLVPFCAALREFTSAVTYKLAGNRSPFFARFAYAVPAAYYNVTVTFYVARNSDTARHRGCGASASVSTTVAAVHLDKQVLLPSFIPLPLTSSWLVYAASLARNASAVCALRLETVMTYARFMRITSRRFVRMVQSYPGYFHILQKWREWRCQDKNGNLAR